MIGMGTAGTCWHSQNIVTSTSGLASLALQRPPLPDQSTFLPVWLPTDCRPHLTRIDFRHCRNSIPHFFRYDECLCDTKFCFSRNDTRHSSTDCSPTIETILQQEMPRDKTSFVPMSVLVKVSRSGHLEHGALGMKKTTWTEQAHRL